MFKPGYRTTELLLSLLVIVGQLIAALAGELGPKYAAIGAAVTAAGYAVARGLAKLPPAGSVTPQPPPQG